MSFVETAKVLLLEKATELEEQSQRTGVLRSVDATEAARLMHRGAIALRLLVKDMPNEPA